MQKKDWVERLFEGFECQSKSDLARKLGVGPSTVSVGMKGEEPPASWLVKAVRDFKLNPDWIVNGDGVATKYLNVDGLHYHVESIKKLYPDSKVLILF